MLNVTLSKSQALTLLHKLARDDAFRERFECTPADVLVELGVVQPAFDDREATFVLADKSKFEAAHQQLLKSEAAGELRCMIIPQLSVGLSDASVARTPLSSSRADR
ncbi:MAG: NHLP-related RiPP peptide [Mizugakiibacter sp.]|uniref:NHLP-related RiPP peptide n=1 Tax=Mizugakiibacter sp. TaxID=1972610 RepID=UPI0031CC21BE|nr:NHLP-related RiPP peptide [Xanthomonadaceae bacterium]